MPESKTIKLLAPERKFLLQMLEAHLRVTGQKGAFEQYYESPARTDKERAYYLRHQAATKKKREMVTRLVGKIQGTVTPSTNE